MKFRIQGGTSGSSSQIVKTRILVKLLLLWRLPPVSTEKEISRREARAVNSIGPERVATPVDCLFTIKKIDHETSDIRFFYLW